MLKDLSASAQNPSAKSVQLVELNEPAEGGKPLLNGNLDLIQDVKVRVAACVGQREMTVEELFSLREGEVLSLDRLTHEPIDLYLDAKLIGRGELVVVGDSFGIRITELGKSKS